MKSDDHGIHLFDFAREVWKSRALFFSIFVICIAVAERDLLALLFSMDTAIASDATPAPLILPVVVADVVKASLVGAALGALAVMVRIRHDRRSRS